MVDTFTNTYEVHKGMWVSFLLIIYASARSFWLVSLVVKT